jgi:hypothetical protein
MRVSLVPAYKPCVSPNTTHGAPLAFGSCDPPVQESDHLTVGTPDANGAGANSVGSVTLNAVVGDPGTTADEADVRVATSVSDVRRRADLTDYTGELLGRIPVRITDRYNGDSLGETATVSDVPLDVPVPCAATASSGIGGTCAGNTTLDALLPRCSMEAVTALPTPKPTTRCSRGREFSCRDMDGAPFVKWPALIGPPSGRSERFGASGPPGAMVQASRLLWSA